MNNTLDKSLQREVQAHLGWDALTWAQYVYDCGLTYLQCLMPGYPQVQQQIIRKATFWNWWKAHWEKRDMQFLESIDYDPSPILDPVECYKEQHDPRTLSEAIYLNGQVLEESYAEMFGKINKEYSGKKKGVAA